jgi:hypothetical protein
MEGMGVAHITEESVQRVDPCIDHAGFPPVL